MRSTYPEVCVSCFKPRTGNTWEWKTELCPTCEGKRAADRAVDRTLNMENLERKLAAYHDEMVAKKDLLSDLKACLAELERRYTLLLSIGPVDETWNASEDFKRGWDRCREMVREMINGKVEAE